MPKKNQVRTLMDSQYVKGSERLLKFARQYLCHIFWSLWKKISSTTSLLDVCEILRLCVNILTSYDKYSTSVKASVKRKQFKCNYLTIKIFFWISFLIFEIYIKFEILLKKRWASEVICFWNYRLQKAGLLKCLKSVVSEHLSTVNMLKGPKDFLNVHGSIFVIFFDNSARKSTRKISS